MPDEVDVIEHRGQHAVEVLLPYLQPVRLRLYNGLVQCQSVPQHDGVLHHGEEPEDLFLSIVALLAQQVTEGLHAARELVPVLAPGRMRHHEATQVHLHAVAQRVEGVLQKNPQK